MADESEQRLKIRRLLNDASDSKEISLLIQKIVGEEMDSSKPVDRDRIGSLILQNSTFRQYIENMGLVEEAHAAQDIPPPSVIAPPLPPGVPGLRVRITRMIVKTAGSLDKGTALELHLQFGSDRAEVAPLSLSRDIALRNTFFFPLGAAGEELAATPFFDTPFTLHVVLVASHPNGNRATLGVRAVKWRQVLHTPSCEIALDLCSTYSPTTVVATVFMELSGVHTPELSRSHFDVLNQNSNALVETSYKNFIEATERWWAAFRAAWTARHTASTALDLRRVPLSEPGEFGHTVPVLAIVQPIPHHLQYPAVTDPEAAHRFVSLLPYTTTSIPGGGRHRVWHNLHTIVARGAGDVEDHAALLCSLLLGQGLDAFIAIGSSYPEKADTSAWVVTFTRDDPGAPTFWHPCFCQRLSWAEIAANPSVLPLSTIDCMFNHESVFVNFSLQAMIHPGIDFNIRDPGQTQWREISLDTLAPFAPGPLALFRDRPPRILPMQLHHAVPLVPGPLSVRPWAGFKGVHETMRDLEVQLMDRIRERRLGAGQELTVESAALKAVLGAMPGRMEAEKVHNMTCQLPEITDLTQDQLRRVSRPGQRLIAVPLVCSHIAGGRVFSQFLQSAQGMDVVDCKAHDPQFAVAAGVFPYAERAVATWVVIGVVFTPFTS
ncbi:hypothetical protein J8273_5080 [Carpediemonas membranifera]|uniref:CEP76 C2 domain-containing protein n=1 Tax=Carpediemonas membranifera TaxID=201153 RepID=A0A8J6E2N3_9EUKA|nr:hypothetical protein J8273_5080 [Carpediemonas membranifera]|eukprot:KAG9392107.1 hypothetical protein J8273_5080 [Carpediemonas membranifera]